jgi:hypothetical protein
MNITYTQNGDYLIPNIVIRKTKPLGHYGRLRKAYLEMHRPILFNELVLSDKNRTNFFIQLNIKDISNTSHIAGCT